MFTFWQASRSKHWGCASASQPITPGSSLGPIKFISWHFVIVLTPALMAQADWNTKSQFEGLCGVETIQAGHIFLFQLMLIALLGHTLPEMDGYLHLTTVCGEPRIDTGHSPTSSIDIQTHYSSTRSSQPVFHASTLFASLKCSNGSSHMAERKKCIFVHMIKFCIKYLL